jgi:hypothetical protein
MPNALGTVLRDGSAQKQIHCKRTEGTYNILLQMFNKIFVSIFI